MPPADYAHRLTVPLLLAAGAVLYLSFGFTEMAGSDLWWHIAAGRELVQTGTLWMVDDWSYTELGSDWLNHEWLSDLIYHGWVSLFGLETLVYWKWLVIAGTFLLLQLALARSTGSHLAGFLCAGVAAAIAAPFLDIRPHLYTLFNFCLLLWLLLGRRASLWILVPLFVVWVNLHGGFFFGLMALGILLFPWRDLSLSAVRAALLTGLACVAAAAVNPSGLGTFLYPLKYAFDETSPFRTLGEWLPPSISGGIQSPLFFIFQWAPVAAALYLLPVVRRRTGVPWEGIALTVLTLSMALTSRRFIPLFAISLAVLLAPLVGAVLRLLPGRLAETGLAAAALVFALWRLQPYPLQAGPAFHYLVAEYSYPVDTVNFMQANGITGRVFAYYNWGGYLHLRTDGALKVYIDGRADTLFDAATYNNYVAVMRSAPDWLERIEATEADYILWPYVMRDGMGKLRALAESDDWVPVYRDSVSWLVARSAIGTPENPQPSPPGPWHDVAVAQVAAERGELDRALEYVDKTRAVMPWHLRACTLESRIYAGRGDPDAAERVLRECRAWFPSRSLQPR